MPPVLPDVRLSRRFEVILEAVSKFPDRSFPQAFSTPAELEAAYRFLNNERVDWQELLAPEIDQTVAVSEPTSPRAASPVIIIARSFGH